MAWMEEELSSEQNDLEQPCSLVDESLVVCAAPQAQQEVKHFRQAPWRAGGERAGGAAGGCWLRATRAQRTRSLRARLEPLALLEPPPSPRSALLLVQVLLRLLASHGRCLSLRASPSRALYRYDRPQRRSDYNKAAGQRPHPLAARSPRRIPPTGGWAIPGVWRSTSTYGGPGCGGEQSPSRSRIDLCSKRRRDLALISRLL